MQKNHTRRILAIGFIVLFIGVGIHPAFAMYTKISSVSEIHNKSVDLALAEIIPYKYYELNPNSYILIFGPRIKNVGDEDYNGDIGYTGVAINLRNNKEVDTCQIKYSGSLKPGESYYDNLGGLIFEVGPLIPTIYSLRFTATPSDSNPDNNYREETYLIRAGLWGPEYIYIPNTRNLNTNNNQNEECRECNEISDADLIRVERLLDRVEVYSKLLLVLSKHNPELREISEDLSYRISKSLNLFEEIKTYIQFQDKPLICYILEPLHMTIFGMILLLNQYLEYYANPLLQILLTPFYASIIVIYFSLDKWMDKIGCLTGPEPPP